MAKQAVAIQQPNFNLLKEGESVLIIANGHEDKLDRFLRAKFRGYTKVGVNEFVKIEMLTGPSGMPRRKTMYALPKSRIFLTAPIKTIYSPAIYKKAK